MDRAQIAEKLREVVAAVVEKQGLEFVHLEFVGTPRKPTLRVFIDKPVGVSHADCSDTSRELEKVLDAGDLIPAAYILEVSSPGIERGLYSQKDFERFAGNMAKVKTKQPFNGQKNFRGKIIEAGDGKILFEDKTSGRIELKFEDISKANLEIDLEEELRRNK